MAICQLTNQRHHNIESVIKQKATPIGPELTYKSVPHQPPWHKTRESTVACECRTRRGLYGRHKAAWSSGRLIFVFPTSPLLYYILALANKTARETVTFIWLWASFSARLSREQITPRLLAAFCRARAQAPGWWEDCNVKWRHAIFVLPHEQILLDR
jgi:hypothetical protein